MNCAAPGLLMPTWLCVRCDEVEIEGAGRELAARAAQFEREGDEMMNDLATTVTATGAPSSREQRARQSLEYHLERLRIATRLGAYRPNLDVLVSQCERLLDEMGSGESVAPYRDALGRAKARVAR